MSTQSKYYHADDNTKPHLQTHPDHVRRIDVKGNRIVRSYHFMRNYAERLWEPVCLCTLWCNLVQHVCIHFHSVYSGSGHVFVHYVEVELAEL